MKGKSIAKTLHNTTILLLVLLYVFHDKIYAQQKDTSYSLMEVPVISCKQKTVQPSKKSASVDSSILAKYETASVAEVLTSESAIHIKTYSRGGISTTSMRGGNANHTAVLWNGLNIQNAMLGQPDLSILPAVLFNNVSLEYGGGSALWGSGAIGGSIHLNNDLSFNKGITTNLSATIGSFDTKSFGASAALSYKKIASVTKIYYQTSQNNYSYKTDVGVNEGIKKLEHANYYSRGFMQELTFESGKNQKLNARVWYNSTFRNLPAIASINKQHQEDDNLKFTGDWNYTKRRLTSIIRLGLFNDHLNYSDSLSQIYSKSKINTIITESDNIFTINNHVFNFGINNTHYQSNLHSASVGNDTIYNHTLNKLGIFGAYKINLFKNKVSYNIMVRKEFTSQTKVPLTGNSGILYNANRYVTLKVNANKSFRMPTLNDLYWSSGGNINLKPEESYEADGGIEFKVQKQKTSLSVEGTYFNRHTTNWIIWLPSANGNFSPKNIAEVYSRGTETKTEIKFAGKNVKLKLIMNTTYVLSTNQKATSENDNSVGRQIIYSPRYGGQATAVLTYKTISFMINQTHTGYRFTSTDNTSWLNPYYLLNLKCEYIKTLGSIKLKMFGSINNVLNKSYTVVSGRPMPLRNFEAGLSFQYHKPNRKIK